jgi:hypothetical protein
MASASKPGQEPLLGKWRYIDCALKNTGVEGVAEFFPDGTFLFDGEVRQDFPTRPFRRRYRYKLKGAELLVLDKDLPPLEQAPVASYFLVQDGELYFSPRKIRAAADDWSGAARRTNWWYKLARVP